MGGGWSRSKVIVTGHEIDVHDLLQSGQTGDVILVSGTERLSKIIKNATRSKWSHVGILIRDPPDHIFDKYGVATRRGAGFRNPSASSEKESVFLFDSDFEEDQSVSGPTLRPLCDVLHNYTGEHYFGLGVVVAVREMYAAEGRGLSRGLPADKAPPLWPFMEECHGKRFETFDAAGYAELIASIMSTNRREDLSCYFCSELVAEAFQRLGLVPEKKDGGDHSNNFTPQHMTPGNKLDKLLAKSGSGVSLGPLRQIKGLETIRQWVAQTYPITEETEVTEITELS